MQKRKKEGLVLGGGGARGAWQLGVIRRLMLGSENYMPDLVVGTSVGALNAAGLVHGGLPKLLELWRSIHKRSDVFSRNWWPFGGGIYSYKPLLKKVQQIVSGDQIKGSPDCIVAYCDLSSGMIHYPRSRICAYPDFAKYVVASAAMPAIVDPVDGRYVDGALRELVPLQRCIDAGCESITVICCNPWSMQNYKHPWDNTLQIALRSLEILFHERFINDVRSCWRKNHDPSKEYKHIDLRFIAPMPTYQRETLDFGKKTIEQDITLGFNFETTADIRRGDA